MTTIRSTPAEWASRIVKSRIASPAGPTSASCFTPPKRVPRPPAMITRDVSDTLTPVQSAAALESRSPRRNASRAASPDPMRFSSKVNPCSKR